jgi:hypothetical protein
MANTYIYNMSDLWSNSAQQYSAIGMNVTDTASLSTSHLIKLQVGSINRFAVDKSGNVVATSLYANGTIFAPSIVSNGTIVSGNSTANAALFYDAANNSVAQFFANVNNFVQIAFTNINTGNNNSADISIYDSGGLLTNNFINMGITGNAYQNAAWTVTGPSDGYLYTGNTSLGIGTAGSSANIIFFTGGQLAVNERMRMTPANTIIIANSSALVANGSNGVSGAVLQSNGTGLYWSDTLQNIQTITISNTTSTVVANTSSLRLGNTNANTILTLNSLSIANSTANIQIVNPANLFISTNTGFNLGTRTLAANGSSYLPNGLLANWGIVAANTTAGTITFTTPFTTACYIVQLTPALQASNNAYLTAAPSTTAAQARNQSTLAAGSNVYFFALGI